MGKPKYTETELVKIFKDLKARWPEGKLWLFGSYSDLYLMRGNGDTVSMDDIVLTTKIPHTNGEFD